jgi:hypothetical protein
MRTRRTYLTKYNHGEQAEAARIVLERLVFHVKPWVLIAHDAPCAGKSAERCSDPGLRENAQCDQCRPTPGDGPLKVWRTIASPRTATFLAANSCTVQLRL